MWEKKRRGAETREPGSRGGCFGARPRRRPRGWTRRGPCEVGACRASVLGVINMDHGTAASFSCVSRIRVKLQMGARVEL